MKKLIIFGLIVAVFIGVLLHYVVNVNTPVTNPDVNQELEAADTFTVEELPAITASTSAPEPLPVSPLETSIENSEEPVSTPQVAQSEPSVTKEPIPVAAPAPAAAIDEQTSARNEFKNKTMKFSLNNFRAQAEISYSTNQMSP